MKKYNLFGFNDADTNSSTGAQIRNDEKSTFVRGSDIRKQARLTEAGSVEEEEE